MSSLITNPRLLAHTPALSSEPGQLREMTGRAEQVLAEFEYQGRVLDAVRRVVSRPSCWRRGRTTVVVTNVAEGTPAAVYAFYRQRERRRRTGSRSGKLIFKGDRLSCHGFGPTGCDDDFAHGGL